LTFHDHFAQLQHYLHLKSVSRKTDFPVGGSPTRLVPPPARPGATGTAPAARRRAAALFVANRHLVNLNLFVTLNIFQRYLY
jgi:hypothetical protein